MPGERSLQIYPIHQKPLGFPRCLNVYTALANGGYFDELLLRIQKNDSQQFTIEKTHLGTEVGDGDSAIECQGLTLLP